MIALISSRRSAIDWGVSGNYHEFAFGPKFDGQGRLGHAQRRLLRRAGQIDRALARLGADRSIPSARSRRCAADCARRTAWARTPTATMFYTDNQGDWVGTSKLRTSRPAVGTAIRRAIAGTRERACQPPRGEAGLQAAGGLVPVWPHGPQRQRHRCATTPAASSARSRTAVRRRPDQRHDHARRSGEGRRRVPGRVLPVPTGSTAASIACAFGPDGSMFVGETNRGWGRVGDRPYGLQRLVYTGVTPVRDPGNEGPAPDGFELTFTRPVDATHGWRREQLSMSSFTHGTLGEVRLAGDRHGPGECQGRGGRRRWDVGSADRRRPSRRARARAALPGVCAAQRASRCCTRRRTTR